MDALSQIPQTMKTTTQATLSQLPAIEQRAEAATKPPWRESKISSIRVVADDGEGRGMGVIAYTGESTPDYIPTKEAYANVDFIAHARQDIPALISACRDLSTALQAKDAALKVAVDMLSKIVASDEKAVLELKAMGIAEVDSSLVNETKQALAQISNLLKPTGETRRVFATDSGQSAPTHAGEGGEAEPEEMSRAEKYENDAPDREYESERDRKWETHQPEPDL